jgi:hypothetical protein
MAQDGDAGQRDSMVAIVRLHGVLLSLAAAALSSEAQSATAKLVKCGAADCLLVRGHRNSGEAIVRVNDRAVEASGGRSWTVRLPVATVRDWSAPFARTLSVSVVDPAGSSARTEAVRLPVGLLGHDLELASLVVHAP